MGAGKSKILARIAAGGVRCVDLDAEITRREGESVAEIFAGRGEAAFRGLEERVLRELLDEDSPPAAIALGGGTVTNANLRRALLRRGVLVTLMAPLEVLAARVRDGAGRPLLAGGDPRARLAALLESRAPAYAEAHAVVDASAPLEERIAAVERVWAEAPVAIPLGTRSYRVDVGRGVRDRLVAAVRGRRAILVADENTAPWRDELAAALSDPLLVTLRAGEANKSIRAVERIWDAALDGEMDRGDLVVAVGGGVVGDLAGAAAATLFRGVSFGQVPTSLLAMVDSSVGGKTGFNRGQGKNLVGAFHQPEFVLCDVETLTTLPREERIAGLAEVAKAAWLEGETFVAQLERDAPALRRGAEEETIAAIRSAVQLKADIVGRDERESGARMLLNLGHTVGHAIEAAAGYGTLRHGEAVALGMVAASNLAVRRGAMRARDAERMRALLEALCLPTELAPYFTGVAPLRRYLGADKKRRGDALKFVVPGAPGETRVESIALDEVLGLAAPL